MLWILLWTLVGLAGLGVLSSIIFLGAFGWIASRVYGGILDMLWGRKND
jgi:hypothetical protein